MPDDSPAPTHPSVTLAIAPRTRDLGDGFHVRRLLPHVVGPGGQRMIGPFIFFDHFGPVTLPPGQGLDVRPHPHIALATVTYLFEGEIVHRDSLGNSLPITPGAVNWMTAGRGIVHSERSPPAAREAGARLHGIQLWVALPTADEECAPSFHHHPAASIPAVDLPGARVHVVIGEAFGVRSPVAARSPTMYIAAELHAGATLAVPDDPVERAAYVVEGAVACDDRTFDAGTMIVFARDARVQLAAVGTTRVMLLGGAPLEGERFVEWNFVASSRARIEEAKRAWAEDRFPRVPGDELERIPLPG